MISVYPLQIQNLSFSVPNRELLHDVSLSLEKGEILGLLGPNGSGKTTLIRLVSGVSKPTSGKILLGDRDIATLKPTERACEVAVVPQESVFLYPFTALEVVAMGLSPRRPLFAFDDAEALAEVRVVMEQTDCWNLAHRLMETLSGGEKQRVLLARALAQRPKVLLLDEPSSHLDLGHQRAVFELLKNLAGQGMAILLVIHDVNQALSHCDRLCFLKDGKLVIDLKTARDLKSSDLESVFGVAFRKVSSENGGPSWFLPL